MRGFKGYLLFGVLLLVGSVVFAPLEVSLVSNSSLLDNVCSGSMNGFRSVVFPCVVQDIDGKDIIQFVNVSYDGKDSLSNDWVFAYDSPLESFSVFFWNDSLVFDVSYESVILDNVTSLTASGSDVLIGDLVSPELVVSVSQAVNGTSVSRVWGVDSYEDLGGGRFNVSWSIVESSVKGWQDVSGDVVLVGDDLLGRGRSYYRVKRMIFAPGELVQLKWVYTPKDCVKAGEWYVFAHPSSKNLLNAVSSNDYLYLDPWWDTDWAYKRELTIDHTNVDSTLTNFPVLVHLNSTKVGDFSNFKADGADVRFTNSSEEGVGVELPYEIEMWNDTTTEAWIWVQVPFVASGSDTTFYMYYGNDDATDGQNATGVWDEHYEAVYHMNSLSDSTSDDLELYNTGASINVSCPIGFCYYFEGSPDSMGRSTTNMDDEDEYRTLEAWFVTNSHSTPKHQRLVHTYDEAGAFSTLIEVSSDDIYATARLDSSWFDADSDITPTIGTWYYSAGVYSKHYDIGIWVNDAEIDTVALPDQDLYLDGGANSELFLGKDNGDNYLHGNLDEVRISTINRTDAWLKASYYSGLDGLITIGSEEEGEVSYANETEGDEAIVDGIIDAFGGAVIIYSDQQIYISYLSGAQNQSSFDKAVSYGDKVWVFNYVTDGESFSYMDNITNVIYVWEMNDLTASEITTLVNDLIEATN